MLQSLGLCFEYSRSRGEGTMLQIKCRAIVSLTKGILVSISCWNLMQYTMKEEKISVALLVNVLHYREEEKLDIVESRASVIGCKRRKKKIKRSRCTSKFRKRLPSFFYKILF